MAADRPNHDTKAVDDQALDLRVKGRSFGAIARTLGFEKPVEANRAFNRALRRRPEDERATIRSKENERLDRLAKAVRSDASLTPAAVDVRLGTIERLRARLMTD